MKPVHCFKKTMIRTEFSEITILDFSTEKGKIYRDKWIIKMVNLGSVTKCEKWTNQHDKNLGQRIKSESLTGIEERLPGVRRLWVWFLSGTQIFFVPRSYHVNQFIFHKKKKNFFHNTTKIILDFPERQDRGFIFGWTCLYKNLEQAKRVTVTPVTHMPLCDNRICLAGM